jgi:hypothetical protein
MFKVLAGIVVVVSILFVGCCSAQADQVNSQIIRAIDLDNYPNVEFSIVTAATDIITGQGGAISYKFAGSSSTPAAFWVDGIVLRWNSKTDAAFGFSTTVPFGGSTLKDNTRIGAGYLFRDETIIGYVRVPVSW